jgi:aryl-alcohol dehydrogenase-like predicted oxidoreductase
LLGRQVEAALDLGCALFDTADIYGYGTPDGFGGAERLLGLVLRSSPALRHRMVLATKAGIFPPLPYDSGAAYLVQASRVLGLRTVAKHGDLELDAEWLKSVGVDFLQSHTATKLRLLHSLQ